MLKSFLNRFEWKMAIKTGIAASLSLFFGTAFARWFDRPDTMVSGLWTVLSSIVVMQAYLGGTYKAAWARFLGILIGSILGAFFTTVEGSNILSLGISVTCTVMLCSLLNLKESIRIASLSVAVIIISWGNRQEISPWVFSFYRFLDSTIGIIISISVAHSVWPSQATHKMKQEVADTLRMLRRFFNLVVTFREPKEILDKEASELEKRIEHGILNDHIFFSDSELELKTKSSSLEDWRLLITHAESINEAVVPMKQFNIPTITKNFDEPMMLQFRDLLSKIDHMFELLIEMLEREDGEPQTSELRESADVLYEELKRFHTTATSQHVEIKDVEEFFVFFYNLRVIIEELLKLRKRIKIINDLPR